MKPFLPWLLVALGGALGASARYALSTFILERVLSRFPWGTFAVNMIGCFLLGIVGTVLAAHLEGEDAFLRYAVSVGFLGSFTTFSTFGFESMKLLDGQNWPVGAAYLASSVFIGLVMVKLGSLLPGVFAQAG
ncbi:MAG: fluoride exporter [Candidatus Sumerlaeota bacterium]|nr:fluoride exporter [Candidatus Sumerlaeota bacterium]